LRFCFAFFGLAERYGDVSPVCDCRIIRNDNDIGEQIMPEEIAALHRRVSELKNHVMVLALLWAGTIGVWFMKTSPYLARAAQPESLTVKRLAVVDEKGTERVVIAAPLPEPIIHGKREKRDSPVSGMLIYDPKGNERGGYVTSDGGDLAALLTLDSESDQVFTAYANAGSGATVWVANEKHQNVVMSTHNTAVFEITHGKKVVYKQPPDAADLKQ
jgi:hypothetical protein